MTSGGDPLFRLLQSYYIPPYLAIIRGECSNSVVSQFENPGLSGRDFLCEVSGATTPIGVVWQLRRKAAPRTRYGPIQDVPCGVEVAVNLQIALRAVVNTDRQILPDHSSASRALLRGVP